MVGLLIFMVMFASAWKAASQKKFIFWYPWAMAFALAIVFLLGGHHLGKNGTNAVVTAFSNIKQVLEVNAGWFKWHNTGIGTLF